MYLTDQQVKDKLFEGDLQAVILNYMDFANYLADRVARRSITHEHKDIRSVAILAMIEGVHLLKGHDNPGGFLRLKIKGAVINYVRRQHTIYVPEGRKIDYKMEYLEDVRDEKETLPKEFGEDFDSVGELIEKEVTESFLLSPIERTIIKMRIEGSTIEDISEKTGLLWIQVQRILQGTKDRVVKILNGDY